MDHKRRRAGVFGLAYTEVQPFFCEPPYERMFPGPILTAGNDGPVLELRSVNKRFGAIPVLRDLSLSLQHHRVTAIVGPSGCGKSTLLKLCNGLVLPDSGNVCAFGRILTADNVVSLRRRMGFAVQGSGLFPHLTARGNITVAATLARWSEQAIGSRLEELLGLMHLDHALLDRYPHELSGGQQQRVGLCRAMMLRPEVLLLDEPFAAIDPITRYDIHRQLQATLEVEPAAVLLVTHDMREAMQLADRVVIMDQGRVRVDASTAQLRAAQPDLEPEALLQQLMEPVA